eukprot:NODE_20575_length_791_cov_7.131024.p1 GENE.NODE_20575_length_791_cov_7.131024~~NODE_20575_length_791_cov_7.131024.p1  ORF type:complete len:142 (-),score=40.05 NODE_20575_length_791_cov_7.131024:85-510(-)
MHNLALSLLQAGRLFEAERLLREVVKTRQRVLGKFDTNTLISLNNLAAVLQLKGPAYAQEAKDLCVEALEGYRYAYGNGHPDTLKIVKNLSLLCSDLQQHEEAAAYLEQATEGFSKLNESDWPGMNIAALKDALVQKEVAE